MAKKHYICIACFLISVLVLSGCGETVRGIGRDCRRIGAGVKKIFIADA